MMENIFSEIPENSLRDNVLQYAKTTYGQRRSGSGALIPISWCCVTKTIRNGTVW